MAILKPLRKVERANTIVSFPSSIVSYTNHRDSNHWLTAKGTHMVTPPGVIREALSKMGHTFTYTEFQAAYTKLGGSPSGSKSALSHLMHCKKHPKIKQIGPKTYMII